MKNFRCSLTTPTAVTALGHPAYFSRDYKKQFGAPPQRDIARLRGSLEPGGAPARV